MTNIIIVHGANSTPDSNWYMWLKGKLVGRGYKVWLPLLPETDNDLESTSRFLLANPDFSVNKDSILIGHSSGATLVLDMLQNLPDGIKVKEALLVSPLIADTADDSVFGKLNFKKIQKHCAKFTVIHSDDDPYTSPKETQLLATRTNGELIVFSGQGNFSVEVTKHYKQFPEIMQFIDEAI